MHAISALNYNKNCFIIENKINPRLIYTCNYLNLLIKIVSLSRLVLDDQCWSTIGSRCFLTWCVTCDVNSPAITKHRPNVGPMLGQRAQQLVDVSCLLGTRAALPQDVGGRHGRHIDRNKSTA